MEKKILFFIDKNWKYIYHFKELKCLSLEFISKNYKCMGWCTLSKVIDKIYMCAYMPDYVKVYNMHKVNEYFKGE